MNLRAIAILCSFLLAASACHKKKTEALPDLGYSYFPVNIGYWVVYEVDSTGWNNGVKTHVQYQLKEIIESQFTDNTGKPAQRIERYKRYLNDSIPYDSLAWNMAEVWTGNLTPKTAERVEDNQRFLKLIFPPKEGDSWNGYIFTAFSPWTFRYAKTDVAATHTFTFDSTLTVTQTGLNDPVVYSQYCEEQYARHVGLIYKSFTDLEINPDTTGSSYTQILIDYLR